MAHEGVLANPRLIIDGLASFWEEFTNGRVGHVKKYLEFDKNVPGWEQGALVGRAGGYSGTKDIHFPNRSSMPNAVSQTDIILRDADSGERLLSLEARAISNGRTGWYAHQAFALFFPIQRDVDVFVIGAGSVARNAILFLTEGFADRISRISIYSRGTSNEKLVAELQPNLQTRLVAVADKTLLSQADFVIAATNTRAPVVTVEELGSNTRTLGLGVDEFPASYFDELIARKGPMVVDDIDAVESRNRDAVAYYYSRKGQRLSEEGRKDGVQNYADVFKNSAVMAKLEEVGPAHMCAVGLASIDIKVASHIYELLVAKYSETA